LEAPKLRDKLLMATEHLAQHDEIVASLIEQVGPCRLRFERNRFRMLVRSIIGQQLSAKAASTIRARFETLIGSTQYQPEEVLALSFDQLRSVGLSSGKATYIAELAEGVSSQRVQLNRLGRLSDDQVIEELTRIKGVGRWTAHMFLIFSLGRLDILPYDDMGVRGAIRRFYQLKDVPDHDTMDRIAKPWRPFASVASWYCWQGLDLKISG
jgi:DNA-3-methyladenine glycosylase II